MKAPSRTSKSKKKTASSTGARKKKSAAPKRMTIKSVAEAAGVSIATVSFVLNDRPGQVISEPVKKRVIEAARALNYAPSAAAAGLARKHTRNVSIVFYRNDHLITNQLYSFAVQGAIKEAGERGYNILFSFLRDEFKGYADLPKVVREKNSDGVLFIHDVSADLVQEIKDREISVVAVDSHPPVPGLTTVYVDNDKGARLACRHLLDLGHRELAFLRAGKGRPSIDDRTDGFLDEMRSAGVRVNRTRVLIDARELTFQAGYDRAKRALAKRPELTGLFCANDELAAGALRAARELGRNVPGDLSVVGFDDIIMANYVDPPLTTVGFDKEGMGRRAMALLLDLLGGKRKEVTREVLDVELVTRGSTGPAPG